TVLSLMEGTPQLVAKLLYGSGLRIMEAVRLRVKDIDVAMKQLIVRSGKGDKDRFTTFPATLIPVPSEPPRQGQNPASAGSGAGPWGRLPAPGASTEISAGRDGMGLAVRLSRAYRGRRPPL